MLGAHDCWLLQVHDAVMHNIKKKKKKAKLAANPLPQKHVKGKDKAMVATTNNITKVGNTITLNRVPATVNAATATPTGNCGCRSTTMGTHPM
jgi:hypothetical protein